MLADLRTKHGRRQAIDPVLFTTARAAHGRVYGSTQTIAQILAGRRTGLDQRLVYHVNKAYIDGVSDFLKDANDLCLNWDPGSYSGTQWLLGIFYAIGSAVSGVLPPRVPISLLSQESARCDAPTPTPTPKR